MKKKIVIFLLVLIILIVTIVMMIKLFDGNVPFKSTSEDEIYVNIVQNEEKSEELKLNTDNTTNYYYFKITNYNTEISKYNQTEVIPYVKLDFENETDILTHKLYRVDSLKDSEEEWKEILEKGESETSFEEYYKCEKLLPYEEGFDTINEHNYVLKIELNSESEDFINLEQDINSKFSIVLGYKEVK